MRTSRLEAEVKELQAALQAATGHVDALEARARELAQAQARVVELEGDLALARDALSADVEAKKRLAARGARRGCERSTQALGPWHAELTGPRGIRTTRSQCPTWRQPTSRAWPSALLRRSRTRSTPSPSARPRSTSPPPSPRASRWAASFCCARGQAPRSRAPREWRVLRPCSLSLSRARAGPRARAVGGQGCVGARAAGGEAPRRGAGRGARRAGGARAAAGAAPAAGAGGRATGASPGPPLLSSVLCSAAGGRSETRTLQLAALLALVQVAELQQQLRSAQARAADLTEALAQREAGVLAERAAWDQEHQGLRRELDAALEVRQPPPQTGPPPLEDARARVSSPSPLLLWRLASSWCAQDRARLESAHAEAQAQVSQLQQQAASSASGAAPPAVAGPTAQQQALLAHMAQRLEALEAGHRCAPRARTHDHHPAFQKGRVEGLRDVALPPSWCVRAGRPCSGCRTRLPPSRTSATRRWARRSAWPPSCRARRSSTPSPWRRCVTRL